MRELEAIVTEAERARTADKPAALATVVGVEGSAYRLPGARMLIVDGRWTAGSISGGCLEDDVVLRAAEAIARGEALVTTYDTTSDDDIVFGVGLGCKGVITILIEPIRAPGEAVDLLSFATTCITNRIGGVVATVIRTHGALAAKPGERLLLAGASAVSDVEDAGLAQAMRKAAHAAPAGSAELVTIELEQGSAEIFVERLEPPTPLVVFGAGHDTMPIVRLAKELGWHVTVIDHRPAYATSSRFPQADRIVVCAPKDVPEQGVLTDDTLALVMTHNYLRDLDLLEVLLPSPVRYLGLLGPRRRNEQLLADLRSRGIEPTVEQLSRLYAPVGLDVGSETPAEVALSILSEMQAVMTDHRGGHLRARKRPIHQPETAVCAVA
ncbi:MAG TPA: XdhC family protein [Burkholderiales bacterium]|nr:XdhC family protein [Burkholderiales bacterium]